MDNNEDTLKQKKHAILFAVVISLGIIASLVKRLICGETSIESVLISGPIALAIGLIIPALMYFWKGPIR